MPRKSDKDPNKPKGRTSAYAFFVQDMKETPEGKSLKFTEFSKYCSEQWKKMDEDDKQKFIDLSQEDRTRYKKEMAAYQKTAPAAGRGAGGRKKKDASLPKRNLSAFMFFSNAKRPKIKSQNPEASIGEIAKQLGAAWNVMTPEQKKPYEEEAKKDKQRYLDEMQRCKEGGKVPSKGATSRKSSKKSKPIVEPEDDEDEDEEEEEEEDEEDSSD